MNDGLKLLLYGGFIRCFLVFLSIVLCCCWSLFSMFSIGVTYLVGVLPLRKAIGCWHVSQPVRSFGSRGKMSRTERGVLCLQISKVSDVDSSWYTWDDTMRPTTSREAVACKSSKASGNYVCSERIASTTIMTSYFVRRY